MLKEQTQRFNSAEWFPRLADTYILIGGAGGIGSWLTLLTSRLGLKGIFVYDYDIIEIHNLGGQFFRKEDIGKSKVYSLVSSVKVFSDYTISAFQEKIDKAIMTPIVFAAFDNMQARTDLFSQWERKYGADPNALFVDGRLLAEQLQIFAIKGGDSKAISEYSSLHLFDDKEVPDLVCSLKQTSHVAAMIAALMVSTFTNHITNIELGKPVRNVPFYMEYFTPLHLLTLQVKPDGTTN